MGSEVCGEQPTWITSKQQPAVAVKRLLAKDRWYSLPESCRFAERRSMPAFPSLPVGFSYQAVGRTSADSWIVGSHFPSVQRPKFEVGAFCGSSGIALATKNPTNASSKKTTSISRFANGTDAVVETTKETKRDRYAQDEDRNFSDDQAATPESSKREHHTESQGWKLRVVASSRSQSPNFQASDVIGTIDFNADGNFFATGGIARKIRICSYSQIIDENVETLLSLDEDTELSEDENGRSPTRKRNVKLKGDKKFATTGEICTPGKLSSLKWRPDGSEVIGCGDYDGVVLEWSVEHGHTVSERYEHSGQRVWSLDYSMLTPTLSASSSEDGTVRVWSRGIEKSVSVISPQSGNSVCSVEFNPVVQHLIAVASADANVYLYDLRRPDVSLSKLCGHGRAVSYVRFLGKDKLVSASIDSTLKLWNISESIGGVEAVDSQLSQSRASDDGGGHLVRTFSAHTNVKHFAGLSVHKGASILACGSETDEVFLYKDSNTVPLVHHKFPSKYVDYNSGREGSTNPYVGAVCWREQGDNYAFVAANSEGVVQVFQAVTC